MSFLMKIEEPRINVGTKVGYWRMVMKMRNTGCRAGFEPTPLAFQAIVLTITPPRLPAVTILSMSTRLCM